MNAAWILFHRHLSLFCLFFFSIVLGLLVLFENRSCPSIVSNPYIRKRNHSSAFMERAREWKEELLIFRDALALHILYTVYTVFVAWILKQMFGVVAAAHAGLSQLVRRPPNSKKEKCEIGKDNKKYISASSIIIYCTFLYTGCAVRAWNEFTASPPTFSTFHFHICLLLFLFRCVCKFCQKKLKGGSTT